MKELYFYDDEVEASINFINTLAGFTHGNFAFILWG